MWRHDARANVRCVPTMSTTERRHENETTNERRHENEKPVAGRPSGKLGHCESGRTEAQMSTCRRVGMTCRVFEQNRTQAVPGGQHCQVLTTVRLWSVRNADSPLLCMTSHRRPLVCASSTKSLHAHVATHALHQGAAGESHESDEREGEGLWTPRTSGAIDVS